MSQVTELVELVDTRVTGSPGAAKAAEYVANILEKAGLEVTRDDVGLEKEASAKIHESGHKAAYARSSLTKGVGVDFQDV